jgi:class 3 adenylate cyclase/predicted negative regulator of RcsB-dependent stress response
MMHFTGKRSVSLLSILILFACLISPCILSAKNYDYLLHRSFGDRFEDLRQLREDVLSLKDSTAIMSKYKELEQWAHQQNDEELRYHFRLMQYNYIGDNYPANSNAEQNFVSLIETFGNQPQFTNVKLHAMWLASEYYWRAPRRATLSLVYALQAYNIYSNLPDDESPAKYLYLYDLTQKFYYYADYATVQKLLHEAMRLKRKYEHPGYHNFMNLMGLSFRYTGVYDSAVYYFKLAYAAVDTTRDNVWLGIINGNIGKTYYEEKKYDLALPLLEQDVRYCMERNRATDNATKSMAILGDIYLQKGNTEKAYRLLTTAMKLVRQYDYWKRYGITEYVYSGLAKVYKARGDDALAVAFMDSTMRVRDSIIKGRNALILAGAQTITEAQKYQAEYDKKKLADSIQLLNARRVAMLKLQRQKALTYAGFAGVLVLLGFSFFIYKERRKSDKLLLNILPSEIARELKKTGNTTARSFDDVTIIFTDFVNFTGASERMSSQELLNELNTCFREFDVICGKYNIEKIKTIGDAYLAVAGLPKPYEHHAENVAMAALEIRDFMRLRLLELGDRTFEVRIGIHSGSVVAGIVGVKKFAYDIWGDTVNTAARMEQSSVPGKINISQSTYDIIRNKFSCTYRGEIDAKNKGMMSMYFLDKAEVMEEVTV